MRAWLGRFRDLSINQKFLLCLTLFILLPLLFGFFMVYHSFTRDVWRKTDEQRYLTLADRRQNLGYLFDEMHDHYVKTLHDRNFRALERHYWQQNQLGYERMRNAFTSGFMDDYGSFPYASVLCLSSEGRIVYQYGRDSLRYEASWPVVARYAPVRFELTRFERAQLYKRGDSVPQICVVGDVNSTSATGKSMTLRYGTDENYVFSVIQDRVYGAQCFLVDAQGNIASASDKALLGTSFAAHAGPEAGLTGEDHQRVAARLGGAPEKYLMLRYPIELAQWNLVYFIPVLRLDGQDSLTAALTATAVVACLLFGALFYMVLSKTVIRPINALKNQMLLVGEGAQGRSGRQRGDEVRQLNESFEDMKVRINDLIEKVYKAQLCEKEAQYQALASQVNPHFLYNTLDSIRFCALLNRDAQVAEQVETLSKIFRYVLAFKGETTTIGDEITHLMDYICIQQLRFGERIAYRIDCPDHLRGCESIKLLLQPLCENAIIHGHESSMKGGHVWVRVYEMEGDVLALEVEDDGMGTDQDAVRLELAQNTSPHAMIALKGVRDRVRIKYGAQYGLDFYSETGKGTRVRVRMPRIGGDAR